MDGLICHVGHGQWAIAGDHAVVPARSANGRRQPGGTTTPAAGESARVHGAVATTVPESLSASWMIDQSDLAGSSTENLLAAWASLQAEIARRFGNSNIVGCYGEHLVAAALNGEVRPNLAATWCCLTVAASRSNAAARETGPDGRVPGSTSGTRRLEAGPSRSQRSYTRRGDPLLVDLSSVLQNYRRLRRRAYLHHAHGPPPLLLRTAS